jgi:hypothetical protein
VKRIVTVGLAVVFVNNEPESESMMIFQDNQAVPVGRIKGAVLNLRANKAGEKEQAMPPGPYCSLRIGMRLKFRTFYSYEISIPGENSFTLY